LLLDSFNCSVKLRVRHDVAGIGSAFSGFNLWWGRLTLSFGGGFVEMVAEMEGRLILDFAVLEGFEFIELLASEPET